MNHVAPATAWDLDEHRFDRDTSVLEQLRFALQYAVLAPSSHNSQPWHFMVDNDSVMLCADRLRALPVVDPFDRELVISCGAALFNLRVALSHFGMAHEITLFPTPDDPDVLALVQIRADGARDDSLAPLFGAITERATTRKPFSEAPVPQTLQQCLIDAGTFEGAQVICIEEAAERARIAELIAAADGLQFADPRFRRELACWIHPQRSGDGIPAHAAGAAAVLDFAVPLVTSAIRTFDLGAGMAAVHEKLVAGSPLIVLIATGNDGKEAWLAAGQALERLLLNAVNAGLSASYLNQPIEVEPLRSHLRTMLGIDAVPQLLLRIGYGPRVEHAPRRPFADVVS